jgi:hypothetical protein
MGKKKCLLESLFFELSKHGKYVNRVIDAGDIMQVEK